MMQDSSDITVSSVAVAVPLPLHSTYTFKVSETLSRFVKRGIRVLVPFQGRQLVGYVTELNLIQPAGIKLRH